MKSFLEKESIKSDLIEMFKELDYDYLWDFSKHDGLHWHEFIDKISDELAIQIGFNVSKNQFLKWFSGEDIDIFVAGDEESEEWDRLCEKIKNKFNIEYQRKETKC